MTKDNNIQDNKKKFIYELQVGGISCTNCAKKIMNGLGELKNVNKSSVNVLSEKVLVELNEDSIDTIAEKLSDLKFKVESIPILINNNNSAKNQRIAYFQANLKNSSKQVQNVSIYDLIKRKVEDITGVISIKIHKQENQQVMLEVTYNPTVIKSQILLTEIQDQNVENLENLLVKNIQLEKFKKKSSVKLQTSFNDLLLALSITFFVIVYALCIPLIDSVFDEVHAYPFEWNIFSIYVLVLFLVTTFVMVKYGVQSLKTAVSGYFRYKVLSMETLIALGSFSAYFMGFFLMILYFIQNEQEEGEVSDEKFEKNRKKQIKMIVHMFESTSLILTIVVLGKYLEGKAKSTILSMTQKMFPENEMLKNQFCTYLEPRNRKLDINQEIKIDVCQFEKGDLMKLEVGQKLLVDGIILKMDGDLQIIDSVCFGQDEPFSVNKGDRVKSGATIAQGSGIMQVENTIEDSMLLKISDQLNNAQHDQESSEDGIQALFKFLSDYFIKFVILLAIIVLIVWFILIATDSVDMDDEFCRYCVPFLNSISVLVASCPCALGLAIPCVITITLNLAMKNSILIKKNTIFEKILNVKSVIFDKTGTLFTKVDKITEFNKIGDDFSIDEIWQTIAVVEKESRHPIAELLYKEALKNLGDNCLNIPFKIIGKVKTHKTGLQAELKKNNQNEMQFLIGNKTLMKDNGIVIDENSQKYLDEQSKQGFTCLMVAIDNKLQFQISLDNTANLREEACEVVNYLQNVLKKDVYILSGDAKETVKKVGEHLDIPEKNLIGETDAESKKQLIQRLKKETGKEVMMIGDGLNDILSIQEAGVGVTINAKSEMNLMASDVVALNENLWLIVSLFKLIQYSRYFIYVNLMWASAYNIFILPVAAGVFYSLNFTVSPTIASLFMSSSSIIVVIFSNFMRLIEFDQSKKYKKKQKFLKKQIVYKETMQTRKQELVNNII